MDLYLVRHAEAKPVGGEIRSDADRPLTATGEADARLVGRALALIDPAMSIVVTSPLARAVQTGKVIGAEVSSHATLLVSDNLAPGFRQKSLIEELIALSGGGSIVAVGHQPDLSNFISMLVASAAYAAIAMAPCAIARVSLKVSPAGDHSEAHLHWLLTPDVIRKIAPGL